MSNLDVLDILNGLDENEIDKDEAVFMGYENVDGAEDSKVNSVEKAEENGETYGNSIQELVNERDVLLLEVEELKIQLMEEHEKYLILEKNQMFEKVILQVGGRNTKAVLALVDVDLASVDELDFLKAVKEVKKSEPYLFFEQDGKIGGTGFKSSKGNRNSIASAFKNGLGI